MTDTRVMTGASPTDVLAMAQTDQITILGNGTIFDPLRTGNGAGTFIAEFDNVFADPDEPRKGRPVVVTSDTPTVGICVVRTGNAAPDANLFPYIVGLIVVSGEVGSSGGPVTIQSSGEITLTAAEWNFVVGNDQGLTTGSPYWLDASGFGQLTGIPPSTPGAAVAQIGIALSSTTLLLSILPPQPRIVSGT